MTLIIGARCTDGVVLAADRRRLSRYERGPSTTKLFKLSCGVAIAGAGDDAVLNEARVLIDRAIKEPECGTSPTTLFDVVQIAASLVNQLVGCYKDMVEEPFGYVLAGPENLKSGEGKLYIICGAGFLDIPWACLGSGSSYARPLVELLLAHKKLSTGDASKVIAPIFSMVSAVQTTVGDGIDLCIVKDNRRAQTITYQKEVNLDMLRLAILGAVGIEIRRSPLASNARLHT